MRSSKRLAEAFASRFAGLDRVYGRYDLPPEARADARGKVEGVRPDGASGGSTRHGRVTVELWTEHLDGVHGLGIVPVRDDATSVFGAIDVDVYPIDLKALAARVRAAGLPLVVCRTKSGGAHLYLFASEPATAELVRRKLLEWSVALGFPTAEVFPKQTRLAGEKDEGNWINVPYFAGARTTRYALDEAGEGVSPEAFLELADRIAVSPAALSGIVAEVAEDGRLEGAPPCLMALASSGFPEGTRNNGLFNVAVYLRKRFEDWPAKVDEYNRELMSPPLGHQEVASIVKSARKKDYSYRCKDQPICSVCNRAVCLTREFGVGQGGEDDPGVVFGPIVKLATDPPTWIWDVDGARLELATAELMDQHRFHAIAIERLNKWPRAVKPATWKGIVIERLSRVEQVQVPEDATREGQLWVHLSRFCTSRVVGRALDELLLGKPYTGEGRTYFCAADFLQYLHQHRVNGVNEKQLYAWLRRRGVEHHFKVLKGKGLNYWSVPAFDAQTEEHGVPRSVEGSM